MTTIPNYVSFCSKFLTEVTLKEEISGTITYDKISNIDEPFPDVSLVVTGLFITSQRRSEVLLNKMLRKIQRYIPLEYNIGTYFNYCSTRGHLCNQTLLKVAV